MKNIIASLVAAAITIFSPYVLACSLMFNIDGDQRKYSYTQLPEFINNELRTRVKHTNDDQDRYKIIISSQCEALDNTKSNKISFTIQKNTVYIKSVNDIPLCEEKNIDGKLDCVKGKYNYVSYKGGANIDINEQTALSAVNILANISTAEQLAKANQSVSEEKRIHDSVRLFAMLLAESTRFDYVLDDIACSIKLKDKIQFMDYWYLVHNWATITSRVVNCAKDLKPASAHDGAGKLFVPVTRDMIPFYNKNIDTCKPDSDTVTDDGKNRPIETRVPKCDLNLTTESLNAERDIIFSLTTMAMVRKDWQSSVQGRGHNIGSILVDNNNNPVYWARNAIRSTNDSTQHGEVRLIQNFLACKGVDKYVDGYTVYTTLEPCAMCSGMMAIAKVNRVVFIQADRLYGNVLKALRDINYPRLYSETTPSTLEQKILLENEYAKFTASNTTQSITNFLLSDTAKSIYDSAYTALSNFRVKYKENEQILSKAMSFLDKVTVETYGEEMKLRCPTTTQKLSLPN